MLARVPVVSRPIYVYAGDSLKSPIYTLKSTAGPIDLTGWTWRCHWKRAIDDDEHIVLEVDSSQAIAGQLRILGTPEQTTAMGGGGVWDIEGTATSDGEVQTWLSGTTSYRKGVTDG